MPSNLPVSIPCLVSDDMQVCIPSPLEGLSSPWLALVSVSGPVLAVPQTLGLGFRGQSLPDMRKVTHRGLTKLVGNPQLVRVLVPSTEAGGSSRGCAPLLPPYLPVTE